MMPSRKLLSLFCLLFVFLLLLSWVPLTTLVSRIVTHLSLLPLLFEPINLRAVEETLKVSLLSLLLALAVSVPAAWVLVRTDLPGRSVFRKTLFFPYTVPPFVFAIGWITLALPQIGLLNRVFFREWVNIYSLFGLVWVLSTGYLSVILSSLCGTIEAMDPSFEEAARVCGAGPLLTFWRISLPCLLPSVASSSLLFLLLVSSAFGIPALVGNPAHEYVLTTRIYTYAKMGGLTGTDRAFVLSLWLFFFSLVFLGINEWVRRNYQYRLMSGKTSRPSLVALGNARWPMFSLFTFICVAFVILPLGAIGLSSFLRIAGALRWNNLTLRNYFYLFEMPETTRATFNSIGLATVTALVCVTAGFFIAYFKDRSKLPFRGFLQRAATFPFAVPGTVLALALIVSYGTGWGFQSLSLLGSPLLLLIAYCSKYLALSVQALTPAISQIDPVLDEAARVCGASPEGVIRRILAPLLRPMLLHVFVLTALPIISELTMSVLLVGAGTETLGTLLFQLTEYANPLAACSLASLLVLFLSVLQIFSHRWIKQGVGT